MKSYWGGSGWRGESSSGRFSSMIIAFRNSQQMATFLKLLAVGVVEHCSLVSPGALHTVLATIRCTWLICLITVSKY